MPVLDWTGVDAGLFHAFHESIAVSDLLPDRALLSAGLVALNRAL